MVRTSLEKILGLLTYGLIQTADWNSELASLNYSAREKWHRFLTLPSSCPFCFDQKAIRGLFYNAVVAIFLFEYLLNLAITLYHELRVGGGGGEGGGRAYNLRCLLIRWCMINSPREFLLKTLDSPFILKNSLNKEIFCSVFSLVFSFSCPSGNSSSETLSANLEVPDRRRRSYFSESGQWKARKPIRCFW